MTEEKVIGYLGFDGEGHSIRLVVNTVGETISNCTILLSRSCLPTGSKVGASGLVLSFT